MPWYRTDDGQDVTLVCVRSRSGQRLACRADAEPGDNPAHGSQCGRFGNGKLCDGPSCDIPKCRGTRNTDGESRADRMGAGANETDETDETDAMPSDRARQHDRGRWRNS